MVSVTGIGARVVCRDVHEARNFSIVAKLALGSVVLATKTITGTIGELSEIISVSFGKPVKIDANKRYTASVVVTGANTYYAYSSTSSTTMSTRKGEVIFTFMKTDVSANTAQTKVFIPQILFRV
ncbi:hypothetical protein AAVH_26497 [Aphelenchoides avenae]|nr:hypothetical protein AAVH_26497 [Aphelenchus avenae]